jgi:hypothetical protein
MMMMDAWMESDGEEMESDGEQVVLFQETGIEVLIDLGRATRS